MDKIENALTQNNEFDPEILGTKFNTLDLDEFINLLRAKIKSNPNIKFNITANWESVAKARAAKALLETSRLNIESFTIRATRAQYNEDINTFESGVKWEEVQ